MEKFEKIKRTSRRGYKIGNMYFTKELADEIVDEANAILEETKKA